jgi:amino acid adenylation domain-containing protein
MDFLLWHGIDRAARAFPDRVAIDDGTRTLRYSELDDETGRFAGFLSNRKVGRGDRVALFLPKSSRSIVSMLGIGRGGATYVPVDPSAPPFRAAFIIGNAAARVLVTNSRLLETLGDFLPQLRTLEAIVVTDSAGGSEAIGDGVTTHDWLEVMAAAPVHDATVNVETDPAYILYTSGSTGAPKGVVISHRNALTFVNWAIETFRVGPEDRLSNHAPLHFDLSVFDIYAALHTGACVLPVPDRLSPFPVLLASWIAEQEITVWYSVPSALIRLLNQGELERFTFPRLRTVLFAGEVFPVRHLREVMERFPASVFFNLYGPTETNVCTYLPVPRPLPESVTELSIGRACANYDAFALRADGERAGVGEEGELVVRGPGVMLGYWGLPERTAASLVQNPLNPHFADSIYRTGDVVRVETDGSFGFLGRRDHMVKTRGYRVELGEIEHTLHQFGSVNSAAVVAVADEEVGARLHAFVVLDEHDQPPLEQLTRFCRDRLPLYAVPEGFHFLAELPRTSSGKVDRQKLVDLVA